MDEVYATLVVRLHHSDAFAQDELWRYAADFKTNAGKQLGNGKKPVKQIVFEGERFDVMSVRRWRERVLTGHAS